MSEMRTFPTSAAVRYDRALRKSGKMNPVPDGTLIPQPTGAWPAENVELLERYRDWLVSGGASTEVINQHRLPMAGHVLGLNLKPHPSIHLEDDFKAAWAYVLAKGKTPGWERNCFHSLNWFRRYLRHERGWAEREDEGYSNIARVQAGLPPWLLDQLTRYLHIRQANWRPSRLAESTYQFWHKYAYLWRWLCGEAGVTMLEEVTRKQIHTFIDRMLVDGQAVNTVNQYLHAFQATLRFMQEQAILVPPQLLTLSGLKESDPLPRFLTDHQVEQIWSGLKQRVDEASTPNKRRDSALNLALFMLLWQGGLRVSEVEDLMCEDVDLPGRRIVVRQAKGLKDRMLYLTETAYEALNAYVKVRGSALSTHFFIYRHKRLSRVLVAVRMKAAGKRVGVHLTPHMLRHTFGTQLLNAGCDITSIRALLGHKRLNTTLIYARVHDETVARDFATAMAQIEGNVLPKSDLETQTAWLETLETANLTPEERLAFERLKGVVHRSLSE